MTHRVDSYLSLDKFFNVCAEDMRKENFQMFEVLEVMRQTPMYSNSESFEKYHELARVVNFTKIADMIHLITHYGAISERMLESVQDEKLASSLLSRKIYSDSYKSQYSLKAIDGALDKAYPDPIGLKDKSKWYSVASRFLTNAFKEVKLQIDKLSYKLYFIDKSGQRTFVEDFTTSSFIDFLEIVLHTSDIFQHQLDWTNDLLTKYVYSLLDSEEFSTDSITNDIIQFNDYYVKDGVFIKGRFSHIPRFYVNFDVSQIIESKEVSTIVKELDEFLLHLCDYDEETVKVFLSRMSTFLLNGERLKTNFSATINVLYGASGQNGKSLFMTLLKRIFNQDDITLAGLRDFNNQNYMLPKMCQSLLVVDEDASDLQLDSTAASNLKQFTHGQRMESRSIYEKTKIYRPRAMVVACTNHMPTSVDKSDGFNRRFSIFTQTHKLVNSEHKRSEEWFESLRSPEAAHYLLDLLILAHLENMKRGRLLENSARMKEINEDFVEKNDSAVMYVRSVGLKEIIGKPVKIVRENYENWCESNGVTALKNKFNTTLESKFNLRSKLCTVKSMTVDESDLLLAGLNPMKQIRTWVHADQEVNQKYLDIFSDSADSLYSIDLSVSDRKLSDQIVDHLVNEDQIHNTTSDEIRHKIAVLMDEESEDRRFKINENVKNRLKKLYNSEIQTVSDLSPEEYEQYISIGKYSKSLAESLKDPRRQVLIYREKKDSSNERN